MGRAGLADREAGKRMRLGVFGPWLEPWSAARPTWQHLEDIGFDVAYLGDHLTHPTLEGRWMADAYTTLAAVAQVTTRLELGTLVASTVIRGPAPLARAAATLQDLSRGRFVLGIGAGVPGDEEVVHGVAGGGRERFETFAETVEAVLALWSGASSWSGSRVRVEGVHPLPAVPGQESPHLMISAHGPRGYELVARLGDGWSSYGGAGAAALPDHDFWELVTKQSQDVTDACERAGRDPSSLRRSLLVGYGSAQPLASEGAYLTTLELAAQAGYDEVVVYWPWPDTAPGDRFWADPDTVARAVAQARG